MREYLIKVEKMYKKFVSYVCLMENSSGEKRVKNKIKAIRANVELRKMLKKFRDKS